MTRKKVFHAFLALMTLTLLIPALVAVAADPPKPTYTDDLAGPFRPVVDGVLNGDYPNYPPSEPADGEWEWDITEPFSVENGDFFATLYHDANPVKAPLARLYLRYDCGGGWLYALVRPNAALGLTINDVSSLDQHYISVDGLTRVDANSSPHAGDPSSTTFFPDPPEFAWVNRDVGNDTADGWEAVIFLPQGYYTTLDVHTRVLWRGEVKLAAVADQSIDLDLRCLPPSAVKLASFTGKSVYRGIRLDWETASEVDNLGFNIYRAASERGLQMRINSALIPSQSPGSTMGAVYRFVDSNVRYRTTYYYWLEDVDIYGEATRHGPVVVTYLPRLRR